MMKKGANYGIASMIFVITMILINGAAIALSIGTAVIALTDQDFLTCFTSVILCLGNIGIGLGGIGVSSTFDIFPDWALWVFSFLMLVGRLELFTVYSIFTRSFWKR